jgi:rhodanese-related sulfurtransferase
MRLVLFFAAIQLGTGFVLQAQMQDEQTRFPQVTTSVKRPIQEVKTISREEVKRYVDQPTPNVFIIDARPASKDDGSRIPSAKPIPFDATIENVTANLPDKNALIIVYCQNTACGASDYLANQLVKWGYQQVFRYPEGLDGWIAAGYSVDHGIPANESKMKKPIVGLPNPDYQRQNK